MEATVGESYSCGLRIDGSAECWGSNIYGQSSLPAGAFQSIDAGQDHVCGLTDANTALCWGFNSSGQLASP